jgi:hypothetical protein
MKLGGEKVYITKLSDREEEKGYEKKGSWMGHSRNTLALAFADSPSGGNNVLRIQMTFANS